MNRLIIIGNGFDLAHGMKTSYHDFISAYLKKVCEAVSKKDNYSDSIITAKRNFDTSLKDLKNYDTVEQILSICCISKSEFNRIFNSQFFDDNAYVPDDKCFKLKFQNNFAETLFGKCKTFKWVDIENEFYEELRGILNSDTVNKEKKLSELNTTMKNLINELQDYMFRLNMPKPISSYIDLFKEEIHKLDNSACPLDKDELPGNSYIVNFNYTKTIDQYMGALHYELNYIHGKAFDKNNPMIFGFGDEIDKDYKKIEEEKIKGFFDYIKSFWYFKTSNYHNLIRFLDSAIYQVYIIGHSCGLSDRTMLNMIFEHNNCRSIKIFYHGDKNHNNYTELTQEISRHFNNKGLMRTKIVSENKCFSMPQYDDLDCLLSASKLCLDLSFYRDFVIAQTVNINKGNHVNINLKNTCENV